MSPSIFHSKAASQPKEIMELFDVMEKKLMNYNLEIGTSFVQSAISGLQNELYFLK
jgi:hypothetical protein